MKLEVIEDCTVNIYKDGDKIGSSFIKSGTILRDAVSLVGGEYGWTNCLGIEFIFDESQVAEVF